MTRKVIKVAPDDSITDAARLMLDNHVSGLPVVDLKGDLVGIVTERDLLRGGPDGPISDPAPQRRFEATGDPEAFRRALRPNTKAFYGEGLGNPALNIFPFEEVGRITRDCGVPLIIDNTCLTPYLNRPFEWGANVVVHSTTKYLAGHSDTVGGAVVVGSVVVVSVGVVVVVLR